MLHLHDLFIPKNKTKITQNKSMMMIKHRVHNPRCIHLIILSCKLVLTRTPSDEMQKYPEIIQ